MHFFFVVHNKAKGKRRFVESIIIFSMPISFILIGTFADRGCMLTHYYPTYWIGIYIGFIRIYIYIYETSKRERAVTLRQFRGRCLASRCGNNGTQYILFRIQCIALSQLTAIEQQSYNRKWVILILICLLPEIICVQLHSTQCIFNICV